MHAATARAWAASGLAHLALGAALGVATAARAPLLPATHVVVLAAGLAHLALALVLGLLPAFARRDWPPPLFTWAAIGLAALGDVAGVGADLAGAGDLRLLAAPHGLALALAALLPLVLLTQGERWTTGDPLLARGQAFRATDGAALSAFGLALAATLAGGVLLALLPRGLPTSALAALLLGAALPAGFGALLFVLPREARAPQTGATLAVAALVVLGVATFVAITSFLRPALADFRGSAAGLALAAVLAVAMLRRVGLRQGRAHEARPILAAAAALAALSSLALLLAVLDGLPNELLPVALYATMALAGALLAGALHAAAPLVLPGRPGAGRWRAWAPALAIAGLFLLAPSFQYPRSPGPGAIVLALGVALLLAGLAPALRADAAAPAPPSRAARRRAR